MAKKELQEAAPKMLAYEGSRSNRSRAREMIKKKGYYNKYRDEYKNKIIDYPESPTGKAYIGIAKRPLMKNESGYGFQGVVIQDCQRRFIQCSGCGKWAKKMTTAHTKKCLGIDMRDYRIKFKLNLTEGLCSDETSLKLTKAALKNKTVYNFKNAKGARGAQSRGSKKGREVQEKRGGQTRQMENRHGTCPEQLKERLYEFIVCNRELPSQRNKGRALYKALKRRYGSFGEALRVHGLPKLKRVGTNMKYTFPDHTVYKYNINKMYDRTALYRMIVQKCPVIKKRLNN